MANTELRESLQWSVPIVAGSFILFIIFARMLFSSTDALVSKITQNRGTLFRYSNAPSILADIKKEKDEAEPYKAALSKMIPNQEDLLNRKSWAESIMRIYNLTGQLSFSNPTPPTPTELGYAPFTIEANGTFTDIRMFLRNIEVTDPRFFISMDSIQIVKNQDTYKANVSGKFFFMEEPTVNR